MLSLPFRITVVAGYRIAWWRSSCPSPVVSTGKKPMLNWNRRGGWPLWTESEICSFKRYSGRMSCFFPPFWLNTATLSYHEVCYAVSFPFVGVCRRSWDLAGKKVSPEMPVALWLMNLYIVIGFFTPLGWFPRFETLTSVRKCKMQKNNSKRDLVGM